MSSFRFNILEDWVEVEQVFKCRYPPCHAQFTTAMDYVAHLTAYGWTRFDHVRCCQQIKRNSMFEE